MEREVSRQQDVEDFKKSANEQPDESLYDSSWLIRGPHWEPEFAGILRLEADPGQSPQETRSMREYHNSGHAIWYLSVLVYAVTYGKRDFRYVEKANRVLGHLSCLREFIQNEDLRYKAALARLIEALLVEFPDDYEKWAHFLFTHWFVIRCFAERYGHNEKCFPMESYRKVRDVVLGTKHRGDSV